MLLDIAGKLAHQRCVNLLKSAQRIPAGINHVTMPDLPPLQFRRLTSSLFAIDLDDLPRELQLLPLHVQDLAKGIEVLGLKMEHVTEKGDRVARTLT